ncbi:LON peptidase substrate-binding domain-containing protein [Enhygromyxa salina]|uniref:ATP-dependent protease La (LON) domain protein n=1 Tax=Enhygromyxa salina TaxID=215803 RepID=A0A2S9XFW1_9BACT|nr:LON peptidase substrate-binding domain-containing protein [Enhygromyxa salina]PRP91571.1 ATP-dependent protease La (LON) domain protein [Enhygromyxa salina]
MLDLDRLPAPDILAALPIFPLPNVVFLPNMVLPLNVFEPRYLDLIDHVLDGGMHLGVPLLRPDPTLLDPSDLALPVHDPGDERPAIEAVLGIGRLIAHQRLPDGRRFVRLEGLGRVRVQEELATAEGGFRRVAVEALPEQQPGDTHALEVLKAQVERMAETFDEDDRQMILTVLEIEDPRVTIYAIASLVPSVEIMRAARRRRSLGGAMPHLRLQQRCLSAEDADIRVELLSERAQSLIDVLGESGSFPVSSLN